MAKHTTESGVNESHNDCEASSELELAVSKIARALLRPKPPAVIESPIQRYMPWIHLATCVFAGVAAISVLIVMYNASRTARAVANLKSDAIVQAADSIKTSAGQIASVPIESAELNKQISKLEALPTKIAEIENQISDRLNAFDSLSQSHTSDLNAKVKKMTDLVASLRESKNELEDLKKATDNHLFLVSQNDPRKVRIAIATDKLQNAISYMLPLSNSWSRQRLVSGWSVEEGIIRSGKFVRSREYGGIEERVSPELDKYTFDEGLRHILIVESSLLPPKVFNKNTNICVDAFLVVDASNSGNSFAEHMKSLAEWTSFCVQHNGSAHFALCKFETKDGKLVPNEESKKNLQSQIYKAASPQWGAD